MMSPHVRPHDALGNGQGFDGTQGNKSLKLFLVAWDGLLLDGWYEVNGTGPPSNAASEVANLVANGW
jgi:hypothetical protein